MVSKVVIYMFMGAMLFFGTANTIVAKLMDLQGFAFPYFQCASMFVGESLCLLFFAIDKWRNRNKEVVAAPPRQESVPKTKLARVVKRMGKFAFAIPAFFDTVGSTLMFLGLVLSAPSIYQMMRGVIIIVVAVYSVIFLKRKLFKHQYFGVGLVFGGITAVGVSSVFAQSSSASNPVLGIIILILGQLFAGGVFVSEEKFLGDMDIHPLQAVGIEGVAGICYYIVLLPIFYAIPCNADGVCSGGHVEDTPAAFAEIGSSALSLFLWLGFILSICVFNFTGVTTTKLTTSLARSTIDTARTLFVWGISLAIGWEQISPFTALEFFGFILLVLGTLIYNQIIVLKFWGMKESVDDCNEYMKKLKEGGDSDNTSLANPDEEKFHTKKKALKSGEKDNYYQLQDS
mmetsp:Transcript_20102/g.37344  ORF Transcript_20102/g.37344 Transcript_20102/m.37344 type:complete len:401 (+) Transcript_20102:3181-4383(+)